MISLEMLQWKRASSCLEGRTFRFLRIAAGYSRGAKDPFEVQEGRCDFARHAVAEKGLISPGGENLLFFSSCGRLFSRCEGDLRDPLVWPQERPVSMRVAKGLSGFLSSRCWVLSPHVESRPEPEDSSPVLTWILEYFWSLHREVRPRVEWGHARPLSSRAVAAVSVFPSS